MKRYLLPLLFLLCSSLIGLAQNPLTISGVVTDSSGAPVPNYVLGVLATDVSGFYGNPSVVTDANGVYTDTIPLPPSNSLNIILNYTDCGGVTLAINIPSVTANVTQNIALTCTWGGGGGPFQCNPVFVWTPDTMGSLTIDFLNGGFVPVPPNQTYAWDFGDGTTGTGINPTHTYATADTYQVCLVVTGQNGCMDSLCQSVIAGPHLPPNLCDASFSALPLGNLVCFVPNNPIAASYAWDFGDGNTSTQSHPNHPYASAGTYNVCLIIDDGNGCKDTSCQSVVVTGGPPTGCNAWFVHTVNGMTVTFTDSSTHAGGATYHWDFGDGDTSIVQNPVHTYAQNGIYLVLLTVTDSTGCTSTFVGFVSIGNSGGCHASFTATAIGNNRVSFSTQLWIGYTYSWDLGDGNTQTDNIFTHTYAAAGTYTVCLVVDDGNGCRDTLCQNISTTPPPPPGLPVIGQVMTNGTPVQDFTAWLIVHDSAAGTLTAIDTFVSDSTQGFFGFAAPPGDYLVKAALNSGDPDYSNYLPTYYGDSLLWSDAIVVNQFMFPFAIINLVPGSNPGGPGFVGGLISQGANKNGPGDPMEGIHVLLMDQNGNPVATTSSNHDGEFGFTNIAYGTYEVIVEVWGRAHDPYTVTLSAANPSIDLLFFEVHSTKIVALGTTSVDDLLADGTSLELFPNPARQSFNLTFNLKRGAEAQVALYDLAGRKVLGETQTLSAGNQKLTYQTEGLTEGMYFLHLSIDGQAFRPEKVIIE